MKNIIQSMLMYRSLQPTYLLMAIILELLLASFFACIYTLTCDERDFSGKQHQGYHWNNFFENFYFSTITMFTIGYGDIAPKSYKARSLVLVQIYITMYIIMIYIPSVFPVKVLG